MQETKVLNKKKVIAPKLRFDGFKDEWKLKNIGSILSVGSGRDYKHLSDGNIPVFGTGGLMTMVDKFLYEGATVCIGRKGTIDKPMYFEGKIWTVDTLFYTHSFLDSNPKFVYNLFQKIKWKEHNEASGVPSLSKTTIEKIKINIPSLPEQQKIASFLSAVDEKIQILNGKKQLLEQYKNGVMQQLFSGKLRFKDENGKTYPKWKDKQLGEIGKIITGSTPGTNNSDFYNGEYLFVSPADINNSRFIINTKTTLTELGFNEGRKVKQGSVLFVCIGSTIGKVAQPSKNCITNQQINSIEAFEDYCNDFIYSLLEFNAARIKPLAGTQAVPQINKTDFSKIKFSFPCLEEQKKIADFLSAIDVKIESLSNQINQTQNFKKGLLQQMFV